MSNFLDNYLRKEISGSDVYYGYSSTMNPSDSDPVWSIRLVSGTSSETVTWSNGNASIQKSIWDNRTDYFTSQAALNPTYSVVTGTSSLGNVPYAQIQLGWDDLSGVDIYSLSIYENGQLLSDSGYSVYSNPNFDNDPSIKIFNKNSYTWNHAKIGVTYSIILTSYNVVGGLQPETFSVYTG